MLSKLADIRIKSTINKLGGAKSKQFIPWQNIQKIALILNQNQQVNKSAIDKFITKHQKYIEVFYIEINSKEPTYADWRCFVKADLNLLKLPKNKIILDLKQKHFDLVINTGDEKDQFAQNVTAALSANYKCGAFEKFNQTNLIIKKTEPFVLNDYLEDVVKYLKMIKN